jgi:ketosteroid isomerase-like protein
VAARRPVIDSLEVSAPALASLLARLVGQLPAGIRRQALQAAFDRARDAFNRGDLEAVFALFAEDVEYAPPPPLHTGAPLHGRAQVLEFWSGVRARYETNMIENLALDESAPGRFVRRARLCHCSSGCSRRLEYTIVQTTELRRGRVVRQVNVLAEAV